ncbi:hypothetical protein C1645_575232 [Glomus cerebriforme]|uniref:Uncharacterized protein n=1 Tax=Glomus cerebriforme TaxID=658196 RepID=A0A397S3X6_9GLOM|nr:hypothetical protein C1645_575232 [Glomus cerebriforme]
MQKPKLQSATCGMGIIPLFYWILTSFYYKNSSLRHKCERFQSRLVLFLRMICLAYFFTYN